MPLGFSCNGRVFTRLQLLGVIPSSSTLVVRAQASSGATIFRIVLSLSMAGPSFADYSGPVNWCPRRRHHQSPAPLTPRTYPPQRHRPALRMDKPTTRGVCMRNKTGPTRQVFVVRTFHDGAGKRGYAVARLRGHTSQRPETKRRFVLFGLSLFQGILYASLYCNRPSNHEAMEGRSRRYAHGNHTRH